MASEHDGLIDLTAVAMMLSISRAHAYSLITSGILPSVRLPSPRAPKGRPMKRVLVDLRDVRKLIDENKERRNA